MARKEKRPGSKERGQDFHNKLNEKNKKSGLSYGGNHRNHQRREKLTRQSLNRIETSFRRSRTS